MKCADCDRELHVGDWPICDDGTGKNGHESPRGMHAFTPYLDENIGDDGKAILITSWKQKQNLMKKHWYKDYEIQTVERGEISRHNWRR